MNRQFTIVYILVNFVTFVLLDIEKQIERQNFFKVIVDCDETRVTNVFIEYVYVGIEFLLKHVFLYWKNKFIEIFHFCLLMLNYAKSNFEVLEMIV